MITVNSTSADITMNGEKLKEVISLDFLGTSLLTFPTKYRLYKSLHISILLYDWIIAKPVCFTLTKNSGCRPLNTIVSKESFAWSTRPTSVCRNMTASLACSQKSCRSKSLLGLDR
ncbi:hypothetical protein DPMN_089877 [Dreissena polymorpha]|uniref:Uncharacterized protein n=1 Tax=Dreissena polymorpha TaxID=45954 RepID=A0A9D4KWQ4_DREPO|nr:hypothetical protein DPMN_089877 [Dreissena polymorpha]